MTIKDQPSTDFLRTKIDPLRINQITHYRVCERHRSRYKNMGLALVILSTLSLALSFFKPSDAFAYIQYLPVIVSLLVAFISAILAFTNDNALALDHQSSAVAYGALLRECEARVSGAFSELENKEYIQEFQARWHSVSCTSPLTSYDDRMNTELKTNKKVDC